MRTPYIVATLAVISSVALAHDHATGVVKERMEMMMAMAKSMKAINNRVRSKSNLADIAREAQAISAHAPHITMLFPAGSNQPPTEATEAVWQKPDDFAAKAAALAAAAHALAEAGPTDLVVLTTRARAVTQTCSDCHELYRRRMR